MTDAELRDAAWAELVQTTIGWLKPNGAPRPTPGTRWKNAKALLDQIGVAPPPPPPPPPPDPAPWSGPITITAGGTYSGSWESKTTSPAVTIATSAPVTITGRVRCLTGGTLVQADAAGCQVTLDHVFAYGGPSRATSNRFLRAVNYKSITVRNCTIENTWGMQFDLEQASSSVLITRNRHHNIQGGLFNNGETPGNFIQFREITKSLITVSWNEIVNEYGKSSPTDLISLYGTWNATIEDNYFDGQYEPGNTDGVYSMNGITLENGASSNTIRRNQLVRGQGYGMFSGNSNLFENNRNVNDGFLPDGVTRDKSGKYEPFWCAAGGTNNHFHGNVGAYISNNGNFEYGRFPGCSEGDLGERANNSYLGPPVTQAMEANELALWQQKLVTNGVTIGA